MPIIEISLFKGRTNAELHEMCCAIQVAIKDAFDIKHDNFHHRIREFDENHQFIPPCMSQNYVFIDVTCLPSKSASQKKTMFEAIHAKLSQFRIKPEDTMILLHEPTKENWCIRGKTPP